MVSNSLNSTQRDAPRPVRLRRREASKYLFEEHGIEVAESTLAKCASTGRGGPAFHKLDGNGVPYYETAELDRWVAAELGSPVVSASQWASRHGER